MEAGQQVQNENMNLNLPDINYIRKGNGLEITASTSDTVQWATSGRAKWLRHQISILISEYKNSKEFFDSSAIRSDDAWEAIAKNCQSDDRRNKFAALKVLYHKAVDLKGLSGGAPHNFTYFDEFHDIFKNYHSVNPPQIASSLRQNIISAGTVESSTSILDEEWPDDPPVAKRRKLNPIDKLITLVEEKNDIGLNNNEERKTYRENKLELKTKMHDDMM